jgi:hypothetical protein
LQSFVLVLVMFVSASTCLVIGVGGFIDDCAIYGIATSLSHVVFPIAFFGSYSCKHFYNTFCKKNKKRRHLVENATAPESERQTFRSSTYFSVSYTNGFTNVGDSIV